MNSALKKNVPQANIKKRFYEGLCAPYADEPTADNLAIVDSDAVGQGVVSVRAFASGEVVFRFYGPVLKEQTLHTLQKAPGVYVDDPIVMGKVLHSCAPNMVCDVMNQTFTATRPIAAGEYLTMDYETTEDELFRSFECQCGAASCRGLIRGRAFR